MLKITNLRNGTIINSTSGKEFEDYIEVTVTGMNDSFAPVIVNGNAAMQNLKHFEARVPVSRQCNTITAEVDDDNYGRFSQSVQVVWDKRSFKRYNFFIDDNIFFLAELHKERPASLFEHFYLKKLKQIHQDYGTKFILNLFYRNDHFPFELGDFTDKYKAEWLDNSDWLKLSFHSYSEFPDRPYQNASPEKLAADYDLLQAEIIRIAGEATFQPPVVIHWAMAKPDSLQVLKSKGVKVLCGQFINSQTSIAETTTNDRVTDIGYFCDKETALYLEQANALYDFKKELFFKKGDACCNLLPQEDIIRKLKAKCEKQQHTISLASHEQYTFPFYSNYIPDHLDRIETAVKILTEYDYKPVFFHDGLLGNEAWK